MEGPRNVVVRTFFSRSNIQRLDPFIHKVYHPPIFWNYSIASFFIFHCCTIKFLPSRSLRECSWCSADCGILGCYLLVPGSGALEWFNDRQCYCRHLLHRHACMLCELFCLIISVQKSMVLFSHHGVDPVPRGYWSAHSILIQLPAAPRCPLGTDELRFVRSF